MIDNRCQNPACGAELPARKPGARGPAKKYCDNTCRARACDTRDPERAAEWYAIALSRRPKVERELMICPYCREEFAAARKDAKHCGDSSCKRRWHNRRMAYYNSRRRALVRTRISKFHPIEIYNRDGWICQICLEPVDHLLEFPDRMSASLDHRVALTNGGAHSEENCQLAHLRCNQQKGAKQLV